MGRVTLTLVLTVHLGTGTFSHSSEGYVDEYSTLFWFATSLGIVFCVCVLELIPIESTLH